MMELETNETCDTCGMEHPRNKRDFMWEYGTRRDPIDAVHEHNLLVIEYRSAKRRHANDAESWQRDKSFFRAMAVIMTALAASYVGLMWASAVPLGWWIARLAQ